MNLNQITVPSLDLTESVPFYEKLVLKLIVEALPNYARFECPNRSSPFSIHKTEELPKGDGIYVYLEFDETDKKVEEIKQIGIQFDLKPTNQSWLWIEARQGDVDGNQLILFYDGENRLNTPWRIKN